MDDVRRDGSAWVATVVRGALAEALALVLPVRCAGCDEPDVALCEACAVLLRPTVTRSSLGVEVWSGATFDGALARVVRALKEDGRTGLARQLAPCLRAAVDAAIGPALVECGRRRGDRAGPDVAGGIPPSRLSSRRTRRAEGRASVHSAARGGAGDRRSARTRTPRSRAERRPLTAGQGCHRASRPGDRRRGDDRRHPRRGGARAAGGRCGGHRRRHDRRDGAPSRVKRRHSEFSRSKEVTAGVHPTSVGNTRRLRVRP